MEAWERAQGPASENLQFKTLNLTVTVKEFDNFALLFDYYL
jgi:hypothetical protein